MKIVLRLVQKIHYKKLITLMKQMLCFEYFIKATESDVGELKKTLKIKKNQ